jgi:hypothetical protein
MEDKEKYERNKFKLDLISDEIKKTDDPYYIMLCLDYMVKYIK